MDHRSFMKRYVWGFGQPADSFTCHKLVEGRADLGSENAYESLLNTIRTTWLASTDCPFEVTGVPVVDDPELSDSDQEQMDFAIYPKSENFQGSCGEIDWPSVELLIAVVLNLSETDDPFGDDTTPNFQTTSDGHKAILDRIICHSTLLLANQHRTHHFSIFLLGSIARIARWDPAGVVVTERFNYKDGPDLLGDFFACICSMSPAQRGHDSSATRVTPGSAEHELMSKRANTPIVQDGHDIGEHARLLFRQTLTESPWYRLEVVCEQNQRHFLVGAPHYVSYGSSCGTRAYVAIDCSDSEGPFVYLKDAWRVDRGGIEREGDVLQYLNDEQVDGVPTLVCHSDVEGPGQVSDSQEVWKIRHPQTGHCIMKKHCHYRLVVKEVGLSMSQFENAQELIYLLSTCIEAHRDAYEKGVIHSDISAWNVLIMIKEKIVDGRLVQKRTGFLTDWSMSKRLCALLNAPRQWGRSGTWQFMSAFLLNSPFAGTSIPDEMEAFFHVLLFYVIRFLPHNCRNVEQFVHDYFDGFQSGIAWGQYYCGVTKQAAVIGGKIRLPGGADLEIYRPSQVPIVTHSEADRHPISLILNALLRLFEARYTLLAKRECPVGRVSTSASSAVPSKIKAYFARFKHLRQKPIKKELTSEEWDSLREKALTLEDHHRVIALMGLFVVDSKLQWPEEDKLADQLRPDSDIHSKQDLAGRNT